jgi:hypothetical protein
VGLLPKRRAGLGSGHRAGSGFDGPGMMGAEKTAWA